MFICQLVVGIIVATCSHDWDKHAVAGWVAVVFVWLCELNNAGPSLPERSTTDL
jgi:hypothetical protein